MMVILSCEVMVCTSLYFFPVTCCLLLDCHYADWRLRRDETIYFYASQGNHPVKRYKFLSARIYCNRIFWTGSGLSVRFAQIGVEDQPEDESNKKKVQRRGGETKFRPLVLMLFSGSYIL